MGAEHNHGNMKGKKLGLSILLNLLITVAQGFNDFLLVWFTCPVDEK